MNTISSAAFAVASLLALLALVTLVRQIRAGMALQRRAAGKAAATERFPVSPRRLISDTAVDIAKTFAGAPRPALDGVSLTVGSGELVALLGPVGLRQDDAAAHHRRARHADRGQSAFRRRGRLAQDRPGAPRRIRLPALCAVPAHDRGREHRLRAAMSRPRIASAKGARSQARAGIAATSSS